MSGFKRKNYGRGHGYFLDDRKLDGVTTIISKGLPKPALVNWAANTAAAMAVDHWDELGALPPSERLKRISAAPNASRDAAALRGTQIHALADKLAHGEEVPVPDELAGHVEACVKFLDDFDVTTVLAERPVYHEKYLYAGTFDLVGLIDGEHWLLDWKTSRSGAYGDTAFQLAAYRWATHYEQPDGGTAPMPEVDKCGVVWLRADGYDLYPYHVTPDVFREFLYIQQCARAADQCRDYKGDAINPPIRTTT